MAGKLTRKINYSVGYKKSSPTKLDSLSFFNSCIKPVTVFSMFLGVFNYWSYLDVIGRLDFMLGSIGNVNSLLLFSFVFILFLVSLCALLFVPSIFISLVNQEDIDRDNPKATLCVGLSFFFSLLFLLIGCISTGVIKSLSVFMLYLFSLVILWVVVINRMIKRVGEDWFKNLFTGFFCGLISIFCLMIVFSLSSLSGLSEDVQFLIVFVVMLSQLVPGKIFFNPKRTGTAKKVQSKRNGFILAFGFGVYMAFLLIPGTAFYSQLSTFKTLGVISLDNHVFRVSESVFDDVVFDKAKWKIESTSGKDNVPIVLNNFKKMDGSILIVGTIGFRTTERVLVCPPSYAKTVDDYAHEGMLRFKTLFDNKKIDLASETMNCVLLVNSADLQQDLLYSEFMKQT
ncbi:hypothetical protein [Serratia marcescens]|uniref:hypothetical protein n=1 Tax=Serratia marcescens TaxID=615 RepID=UPI003ED892E9